MTIMDRIVALGPRSSSLLFSRGFRLFLDGLLLRTLLYHGFLLCQFVTSLLL